MDMKLLLGRLAAMCIVACLLPDPLLAQQPQGRVGAFSLPNSPWDVQWQRFRANVEASGLELEYYIRGELGSEEAMLTALKRNRLQVGGITIQGISSVVPELNVALSPFIFRSEAEVDHIYDTVLLDRANDLLARHDLVIIRWLESGWFSIGAQSPIRQPADLRNLRIGGSPNIAVQSFLTEIGADAIPIASIDLLQALQTGLVDGAIKPTALIYSNLREEVVSVSLLKVAYDTGGLLANKSWYDRLPARYAQALYEGHGTNAEVRREVRQMVAAQINDFRDIGIEVVTPNEEERRLWENASSPVYQKIVQSIGQDAQSVYDEIVDGLQAFRRTIH